MQTILDERANAWSTHVARPTVESSLVLVAGVAAFLTFLIAVPGANGTPA